MYNAQCMKVQTGELEIEVNHYSNLGVRKGLWWGYSVYPSESLMSRCRRDDTAATLTRQRQWPSGISRTKTQIQLIMYKNSTWEIYIRNNKTRRVHWHERANKSKNVHARTIKKIATVPCV